MSITQEQYQAFQSAFDFFNNELFRGELPQALIVLQRKSKALGYFSPEGFTSMETGETLNEIALNPDSFIGLTNLDGVVVQESIVKILSTLIHEMCHHWQFEFGEHKPRKCYHNKEWADMMDSIGLIPDNGTGKRTGAKMSHTIDFNGAFYGSCQEFLQTNAGVLIQRVPEVEKEKKEATKSKLCYVCQGCGAKAWAKPESKIDCGVCKVAMNVEYEE